MVHMYSSLAVLCRIFISSNYKLSIVCPFVETRNLREDKCMGTVRLNWLCSSIYEAVKYQIWKRTAIYVRRGLVMYVSLAARSPVGCSITVNKSKTLDAIVEVSWEEKVVRWFAVYFLTEWIVSVRSYINMPSPL